MVLCEKSKFYELIFQNNYCRLGSQKIRRRLSVNYSYFCTDLCCIRAMQQNTTAFGAIVQITCKYGDEEINLVNI